jgi:hypothetical protein
MRKCLCVGGEKEKEREREREREIDVYHIMRVPT